MSMIELNHVTFAYAKKARPVLRDFSLSVERGEKIFISGVSGVGKSTLLHLVAGLLKPQKGKVKVADRDYQSLSDWKLSLMRARLVGVIYQKFNLLPYLSVWDNISLPGRLFQYWDDAQHPQLAKEYLKRLHLDDFGARRTAELSLGQQQRVALIRLLLQQPQVILADEPTSHLDPANGERLMSALMEYTERSQATLLLVSHQTELQKYCDRVILLRSEEEE